MKCCCHPGLDELTGRLRRRDVKLTRPRRAVLGALQRQLRPLTIRELHASLPAGECDLASVYRAIHRLESAGLVQALHFGDGVPRYELQAEGDAGHHHHLVCTQCAKVTEIAECALCELDRRLATVTGFRAVTHRLEFFGVCPACQ
jgi:Fur family transcriptional regulator, ferric uptake regulator